jgi:hypothetical protein
MTARKSQRSFASPRALPTRFTTTVCALLLSLTPLAAQQSSTPSGGQGPVLSSSEIAQGAILLHFTHAEGGLRLKDSGRNSFEIAGADHTWFPPTLTWSTALSWSPLHSSSNPPPFAIPGRPLRPRRCLMARACLRRLSAPTNRRAVSGNTRALSTRLDVCWKLAL